MGVPILLMIAEGLWSRTRNSLYLPLACGNVCCGSDSVVVSSGATS
jgi:hypothetical protein